MKDLEKNLVYICFTAMAVGTAVIVTLGTILASLHLMAAIKHTWHILGG